MKSRHCRFCGSELPSTSKITKLYCNTACRRQFWSARGVPDNILKPAVESVIKELLPGLVQAELKRLGYFVDPILIDNPIDKPDQAVA